jgi:PPOX class probable F420-dependent enzyme
MAELTDADVGLLTGTGFATLVTVNEDGTPHATITWADAADGHVLVNTAAGRVKDRNLRRDPRAAVLVTAPGDAYRWISITGTVVEATEAGGAAHIDALSRRYDGKPWTPVEGQRRVIFRIRPDHVIRYGA